MLKVENFYKKYKGATKYSAQDINFSLPDGKVLGLIGKNGAGKSTIIKSICGIFPFDKGTITVDGADITKDPIHAKETIGYTSDDHSIYEKLTGRECLNYMASLFLVDKKEKARLIEKYAKDLQITYALDQQIASYSHGMKQKICIIASLLHSPKLWILDEPMLGLDPQTKKTILDFIVKYAKKGNSVLFSSHDIYTVEKVCDYVVIINKGQVRDIIKMPNSKYKTAIELEKHFMELTNN